MSKTKKEEQVSKALYLLPSGFQSLLLSLVRDVE